MSKLIKTFDISDELGWRNIEVMETSDSYEFVAYDQDGEEVKTGLCKLTLPKVVEEQKIELKPNKELIYY